MRINVQSVSRGLLKSAIAVICSASLMADSASGQTVLSYRPAVAVGVPVVGAPIGVAPVVTTRHISAYQYGIPAQPAYSAAVVGSIPATAYQTVVPVAPYTALRPAAAAAIPASPVIGSVVALPVAPIVSYRPVAPTVTAAVSVARVPVAARPAYVAPIYRAPVVVRPKVYVPGQPVRNTLRAITP